MGGISPSEFFLGYQDLIEKRNARASLHFSFKVYIKFFRRYLDGVDAWGIYRDPQVDDPVKELQFQSAGGFLENIHVTREKHKFAELIQKFKCGPLQVRFDEILEKQDVAALIFRVLGGGMWVIHTFPENREARYSSEIRWKYKGRTYRLQPIKFFIKEIDLDGHQGHDNSTV